MTRLFAGPKLAVATHNPGKLREIRELIAPYGFEAVSAGELGLPEPEETGAAFAENALIKAHACATGSGLPSLADDSGLAVDALGGEPGIHSARWGGPARDFAQAMRLVEDALHAKGATTPATRRARFVSVLALAWPDGHEEVFEGTVEGTMVWPPRGLAGFGYDPAFLPDGNTATFGEMSAAEKHGADEPLSHRARAFALLRAACLERRR